MTDVPVLSIAVWAPAAGALLVLLTRGRSSSAAVAFMASLVTLAAVVGVVVEFDKAAPAYQFVEDRAWFPALGIQYKLGVDGISILLVLLTAILTPAVIATSWLSIGKRTKEFMISILLLQTGLLGVFLALDMVLFYVFWELVLIPMYLIIGVCGGPGRIYATIKFFLYTFVGSVLMLVGILVVGLNAGTFDLEVLPGNPLTASMQTWVFLAFFFAFAIKVPMFPFHTWLPDAHVEAPTGGSVILAGVLLKMGAYGFLRFLLPITPLAVDDARGWLVALSVVGIIYGALVAMMQRDFKKLIAYSSVSHMGFVTLGIFSREQIGIDGAIIQMFSHGLVTGALFLCVGIIYERTHTRTIADLGGLARGVPVYATLLGFFTLASLGLPMLSGFAGEFLVLLGAFGLSFVAGGFALVGVVLGAAYMLWMYQRVMLGRLKNVAFSQIGDVNRVELMALAPLVVLVVFVGVSPGTFVSFLDGSTFFLSTYR